MTGLHAGLAVPVAVSVVLLATVRGWAIDTLISSIALVRLLTLRPMTSAWHRLALAVPAVAGLLALLLSRLAQAEQLRLGIVVAGIPLCGVMLFFAARQLPGRRLMPYWGRIGDIVQLLATIALLPVLLWVLGIYSYARAMGG
jgi:hypothetical protein